MMPRTIRTDPLANWCMFEARDRYRILTAPLASPRGFLKSARNIELARKPSRRLSGSSKHLERLHARKTLRQQFLSRGRKKYKRCMKYAQHWRKLRAARPRELLKEIHLHYVAKWVNCGPHFAAATWIALYRTM